MLAFRCDEKGKSREAAMSKTRQVPLLALTLFLTACFPLSSKYPLGERSSDARLVGVWQDEDVEMKFSRSGRHELTLRFSTLDEEAVSEPRSLYYIVLPSQINGRHFMSVKQYFPREFLEDYAAVNDISIRKARQKFRSRDRRMNGYYLGSYEIFEEEGLNHLDIHLIDEESKIVKAALEDKTLKGGLISVKDEEGEEGELVYLTSSTRALTKFVTDHLDETDTLFAFDIAELTRVE